MTKLVLAVTLRPSSRLSAWQAALPSNSSAHFEELEEYSSRSPLAVSAHLDLEELEE